ncbi:MAG TPA: hypothetical protein VFF67_03890 [Thermoplasmata archaeon]|nr:hypothetical protein [Thermoplasmata archaeon]
MVEKFSWVPAIILIVIIAVAGGGSAIFVYYHNVVHPAAAPLVVVEGVNVTVNYIGIFGSGPEEGKVFDTSLYSVGSNDAAYAKSLEFHARGIAKNYTPLDVHVGGNTPSSGYTLGNYSFIQVVTGFWQGLLGLPGNETHTVVVPPNLGYGPKNPACIAEQPLTYTLPVLEMLPGPTFSHQYPGIVATTGASFNDPRYGWPVLILSANASFVTIENEPSVGTTASPAGWPVLVTSVTSTGNGTGTITLENQLSSSQAGHLLGKDFAGTGPCTTQAHGQFIVTAVDPANGTYTEDYNTEVTGQTLLFDVTVVDIFLPVAAATAA